MGGGSFATGVSRGAASPAFACVDGTRMPTPTSGTGTDAFADLLSHAQSALNESAANSFVNVAAVHARFMPQPRSPFHPRYSRIDALDKRASFTLVSR
jgi:hypothetical protein